MIPQRRLLLISDGKAGHLSTSRGMLTLALRTGGGLVATELPVRLRAKFLRPLLRILVNSGLCRWLDRVAGLGWPAWFYSGYRPEPADLVLSTGGDTLYLNVIEGWGRNRPNVFCGSLRGVDSARISLVVHTQASNLPNWLSMEVLPAAVDLDATASAATQFSETRLNGDKKGFWSLLIGGNGSGYRFDGRDVTSLVDGCAALAKQHGKRLLITTSRRTGADAEEQLAQWLTTHPDAPIATCVLYGQRPEKVAAAFMGLAEVVFCTEDSTSMISETVLNQRPLVTVSAGHPYAVPNHIDFLARLTTERRIYRCELSSLTALNLRPFLSSWQTYDGIERTLLAERIGKLLRAPIPKGT